MSAIILYVIRNWRTDNYVKSIRTLRSSDQVNIEWTAARSEAVQLSSSAALRFAEKLRQQGLAVRPEPMDL